MEFNIDIKVGDRVIWNGNIENTIGHIDLDSNKLEIIKDRNN